MPVTTADCKAFLEGHSSQMIIEVCRALTLDENADREGLDEDDLRHLERLARRTKAYPGAWKRLRKYKSDGVVVRDFVNKEIPVVVSVAETKDGLAVHGERTLAGWEFEEHGFEDDGTFDGFEEVMWRHLPPSMLRFAIDPNGPDEPDYCVVYFQPADERFDWDQHIDIVAVLGDETLDVSEQMECTWEFMAGRDETIAYLVSAGMIHDPGLADSLR